MEEVESEDDDDWESEHKALVEKAKVMKLFQSNLHILSVVCH